MLDELRQLRKLQRDTQRIVEQKLREQTEQLSEQQRIEREQFVRDREHLLQTVRTTAYWFYEFALYSQTLLCRCVI